MIPARVDVVMLSLVKDEAAWQMTRKAIETLFISEKMIRFRVILMESNPDFLSLGFDYPEGVQVIMPGDRFNFNRYNNIGLHHAKSEWVAFCNNDLIFHPEWATRLFAAQAFDPRIRSLSPMDPKNPHTPRDKYPESQVVYLGYRIREHFAGWCFVVHRSVFQKTGQFDEAFDFYYADDDFALELRMAGILHGMVPTSRVEHLAFSDSSGSGASFGEKSKQDQQTFHRKWGAQRLIAWKNRLAGVLRAVGHKGSLRWLYRPQSTSSKP